MTDLQPDEASKKGTLKSSFDKTLVIIPIVLVAVLSLWFFTNPEGSLEALNNFGNFFVAKTGWFFLLFSVFMVCFSGWWAFGKYGKVRLGGRDAQPAYTMSAYVMMLFSAGMAAGSVIFSMSEWIYYYTGPPWGIEPQSLEAAEMALPYAYYNWGIGVSCLNMLLAIPFCYSYYIKKNPSLQLGDVAVALIGSQKKSSQIAAKIINLVFIVCVLGSLSCTMGLGIPNISKCISVVFGFKNELLVSVIFTLLIAAIFSFSSYLGISKGLQKLSQINIIWAFIFLALMLFGGSTLFIFDNITNSLGLMIQNYVRMAFNADAVFGRGFGQAWSVFFYCYAWGFVAMTAVVIVKVSYGRTFREMILGNTLAISAGLWVLFGINSSNGMALQLQGKVDVAGILQTKGQHEAVIAILRESILGPTMGVLAFTVMMVLFVATTMDAASLALAGASTKNLKLNEEPRPLLRLIWCLVLTAVPLTLTFLGAGLNSLQSLCNLIGWPIMIIGIYILIKTVKLAKAEKIDKDPALTAR
ncbi:MAG: BCCT family transporter [Spirochaetales bacterium]|jgi:BCCT family betaine/carnitine transporter|nr:BCCT family transporter [Spirochaetales bacterium]